MTDLRLTDAQKKVILIFKTNGSKMSKDQAKSLDKRVINNLLKRDIIRELEDEYVLVEYGQTPYERKSFQRRANRQPKKARKCLCGCGDMTKGGKFMTGHDGKLWGNVMRFVKGKEKLNCDIKNPDVMNYLQTAHWMTPTIWKELNNG